MWAHVVNALLGLWLMAAPAVLGYGGAAQVNDRIAGPLVVTFAVVAWWEATRPARWANLPLGLWLVLAPFVLGYDATAPLVNSLLVGVALGGLACVRGAATHRFGGGWSALWKPERLASAERGSGADE